MKKKKRRRLKRRILLVFTALDLLMIFGMSFSLAYYTSYDEITNRLSAKSMNIELFEEEFSRLSYKERSTLIPNRLLPKDPRVQNVDYTDVFVFIKVTVPVRRSTKVEDNGAVNGDAQAQEVFFLKTEENSELAQTSFNTQENDGGSWIELTEFEEGTDYKSDTRTYVFGYSVYLRAFESTITLFDYIMLKNIRQFEIDPASDIEVVAEAYGIQADGLDGIVKDSASGKNILNEEQLASIYREIEVPENNNG